MARWTLTINNSARDNPVIYVMENDGSGSAADPLSALLGSIPGGGRVKLLSTSSALSRRFLENALIGGSDFPPACKTIAAGATASFEVSPNTQKLRIWTRVNNAFVTKADIDSGRTPWVDRATVAVPSL